LRSVALAEQHVLLQMLECMSGVPWQDGTAPVLSTGPTAAPPAAVHCKAEPAPLPDLNPLSPAFDAAAFAALGSPKGGLKRVAERVAEQQPTTTPAKKRQRDVSCSATKVARVARVAPAPRSETASPARQAETGTADHNGMDLPGLGRLVLSLGAERSELTYFTHGARVKKFLGCLHARQTVHHKQTMREFVKFLQTMPVAERTHAAAREVFGLLLKEVKLR
jgi:hypothetical protein